MAGERERHNLGHELVAATGDSFDDPAGIATNRSADLLDALSHRSVWSAGLEAQRASISSSLETTLPSCWAR